MPSRPVGEPALSAPTISASEPARGAGAGRGTQAAEALRQPQHGDVGAGIAARQARGELRAVADHGEVGALGQYLVRCHHDVVAPQDAAAVATAGADRDGEGGGGETVREGLGKLLE